MKQIFDSISVILRYIASGFIAVLAYMFLYNDSSFINSDSFWFLLFLSVSIGLITYAIHIAYLDKVFYRYVAYRLFKKSSNIVVALQAAILDCDTKMGYDKHQSRKFDKSKVDENDLIFALLTQTYLRNVSENVIVKNLQRLMEKRLALLSFIYCSFYQIAILIIYFAITEGVLHRHGTITEEQITNLIFLSIGAILMLIFGISFDKRICVRDIWAVVQFYQCIDPQGQTAQVQAAQGQTAQGQTAQGQSPPTQNPPIITIKSLLDDVGKNLDGINAEIADTKKIIG
ncbi:MAG TPA: hypothetical protein PLZ00_06090 [Mangrovimonas sp.]|nr:hypothetical protein [Mangrovimonas sp.]